MKNKDGYDFVCPLIGMYPCEKKRRGCNCEERWNAECEHEKLVTQSRIEAAAKRIAMTLGYESGDWRDFELHARAALTTED